MAAGAGRRATWRKEWGHGEMRRIRSSHRGKRNECMRKQYSGIRERLRCRDPALCVRMLHQCVHAGVYMCLSECMCVRECMCVYMCAYLHVSVCVCMCIEAQLVR